MISMSGIELPKASVRSLLTETIDYAGLFPPSQLSMAEAVINFATYRNSNYGWMLGRFVLPAARLSEFVENAGDLISRNAASAWKLSALAAEDINETMRTIKDFNRENNPAVVCDMLEVKATSESKIENTVGALPEGITAYFELSLDANLPTLIEALAKRGQRAKIQNGRRAAGRVSLDAVDNRIHKLCMAAKVPFKATAGLHHPLKCFKPLTYAADAPQGTMHGFLNVLMGPPSPAKAIATLLEEVMEEEFDEAFEFTETGVTWRKEHSLSLAQLIAARKKACTRSARARSTNP